jgi:hypothetical protein
LLAVIWPAVAAPLAVHLHSERAVRATSNLQLMSGNLLRMK